MYRCYQDLFILLDRVTTSIVSQFVQYHTGIKILDYNEKKDSIQTCLIMYLTT